MVRTRNSVWVLLSALLAVWMERAVSFPTRHQQSANSGFTHGVSAEQKHSQTTSRDISHDHNLLNEQKHMQSDQQKHQHHSAGVLPQPEPEEETKPFVLDLKNLPDMSNPDMGSQNPNIQVTIEVLQDPPLEAEMDLVKDWNDDWPTSSSSPSSSPSPSSTVDWLGRKKLFWPLFWGYTDAEPGEDGTRMEESGEDGTRMEESGEDGTRMEESGEDGTSSTDGTVEEEDDYIVEYDSGEPLPSGLGGDWKDSWTPDRSHNEVKEEWSSWTPCSATCGHGNQTRTRSCGDFCTSTESQHCELASCTHDLNSVARVFPFQMENGTETFGTDVDSCEQWLNCKSEFLQRYLQQVLAELPSCPCIYPSEAPNSIINLLDVGHDQTFQWRDASGPKERLDIYKPSAHTCLRSALSGGGTMLAVQNCCYDDQGQLITRGKGAGTPNLVSTEFSPELHFKVDVLPWILCKGDWSRLHAVRPPNNGLHCSENPQQDIFMNELEEAREY